MSNRVQDMKWFAFDGIGPRGGAWSGGNSTNRDWVFNAGGSQMPTDPYLLTLRILGKRGAFRAGANLRINNTLEFQSNGDREVRDIALDLRGGWERRIPAGDRFTLSFDPEERSSTDHD